MIKIINQGKSKEAFLFLKRELCKKIPNEFNMKITNQLTHLLSILCEVVRKWRRYIHQNCLEGRLISNLWFLTYCNTFIGNRADSIHQRNYFLMIYSILLRLSSTWLVMVTITMKDILMIARVPLISYFSLEILFIFHMKLKGKIIVTFFST
jgi:hypothetical protein